MGLSGGLKQFLDGKSAYPLAKAPPVLCAGECVEYHQTESKVAPLAGVSVVIPTLKSATAPLALFVDIMTYLKKLRGTDLPVDGEKSFRADDIADSLLGNFERFASAHASRFSGKVTICLAFDKAGSIPPEKLELQSQRVAGSKTLPYEVDPASQKLRVVDAGLCIDGAAPVPIDMDRLCLTRPLRPFFYRYLAERAALRVWGLPLRLILDAEFSSVEGKPGDGVEDQVWTFDVPAKDSVARLVRAGPEFRVGEGEITAVLWALRFRRTHHCQVWSGDSDLIPMLLLHGREFSFSLTSVLSQAYVFVFSEARKVLAKEGVTAETFLAAVSLIGTDYTKKKHGFHRVPTECIWAAARRWGRNEDRRRDELNPPPLPAPVRSVASILAPSKKKVQAPTASSSSASEEKSTALPEAREGVPWHSVQSFWMFMRDVYTVHARRREEKRKEIYLEDLDATRMSHRELWAAKGKIKLPEPDVARRAFRAFSFVTRYWVSLQGQAGKALEFSDEEKVGDEDVMSNQGLRRFLHLSLNGER